MEDSDKDAGQRKAKLRSLCRFQKTAELTKQTRKKVKQKTESENIKDLLQKEKDITAQNRLLGKRFNRKETFSRKQRAFYKRNKE